jgi:hypothetical protein
MDKYEKVKKIAEKLKIMNIYTHKNLYFEPDFNGFSGKRGIFYGNAYLFASDIISTIMLQKSREGKDFPDPGIGIYDGKTNKLIDAIYWYENPEKIFKYFPISKL